MPPGRGLPIGAYTSQLFGDRRADLRAWREAVGAWLADERHLRLKHPRARVLSCAGHLDALGHRVQRGGVTPLPRAFRRLRARVAAEVGRPARRRPRVGFERSIASTVGNVVF